MKALTFQQVILRLQQFWADYGCTLWQPYSEKVGAGTYNAATVLRVLGPEPWNVAYVEPSYRPDDGRYGDNPNRMQMHFQFQVILKPEPGNPQEVYLKSLEAVGIDRNRHDLRFVEDNWESPALGAWGLGWEVWLDGQEISQYTYFQQAGGFQTDPVAVEFTYGLERIVIALQRVRSVWEIDFDGTNSYGDILLKSEVENCIYDFEIGDVERLSQMYNLFEAEARACLEKDLVIPAHDYVLRCSHTFNLLDSRGAIGVTERAKYFARMRALSRDVAKAFFAQRESLGHPLLKYLKKPELPPLPALDTARLSDNPETLLLEIGTEELPHGDLTDALAQLKTAVPKLLADLLLDHGAVRIEGTPRRLVAGVHDLSPRQPDRELTVKGPPANRAFDAEGNPTKAAEGFARSRGVDVADLQVREIDGGQYVVAAVKQVGRTAGEVLVEALPGLVARLSFAKSMRWNASNIAFSRPIRWFVALLGDVVLPFEYASVQSGRISRGLRQYGSPDIEIPHAGQYGKLMADAKIVVDVAQRRQIICQQAEALAAEVGGTIPDDPALLDEVTDLVELPTALRGSFETDYLKLPADILISVMKKHQRYFPLVDQKSKLLPHFIAVRNGDEQNLPVVRLGNEDVIRARFADASFFYKADTKRHLGCFLPRLDTLTFQERLGSMLDKVRRIEKLAPRIGEMLRLAPAELMTVHRVAELCKADLATQMVVEMTSLQGIMGREYARLSGEPEAVAEGIFEHHLPRFAGDALPASMPGLIVGLADKLDSLVALFAVGLQPTGTKDPFALRRAALGIVQVLLGKQVRLDLRRGIEMAVEMLPEGIVGDAVMGEGVQVAVLDYIVQRLRGVLLEEGLRYDVVDAALTERCHDPALARQTAVDLAEWGERKDWMALLNAYGRCARIVRGEEKPGLFDPQAITEDATAHLYDALRVAQSTISDRRTVGEVLRAIQKLVPDINAFFDTVLVMDPDPAVRQNRLALVQSVAALTEGVVDLSLLEGF
ncbi:MAG: glycine--tRNA ligase subunit beta [Anaerolineae bacterium]|nr:glycine--tRNA ligase subunit beta [Anaerolineae bacterium]